MKSKILEMKKMKVCPVCETSLSMEDRYCSKCGAEQEVPEEIQEAEVLDDTTCPYCNAKLDKNATFCTACGTKLEA
jgi:ribosomal protein L40E